MTGQGRKILLLYLAMTIGLVGLSESAQAVADRELASVGSDTYLYHYQYDTIRLPNLLDLGDSVALLSWVRFSRLPNQVSGSLVLHKESIDSFQEHIRGEAIRSVQHEYVVPHPTGWWSLHISGASRDPESVRSVKRHLDRSPLEFDVDSGNEVSARRWPEFAGKFGKCGRSLGQFFHVTLNCSAENSDRSSEVSMGYAFFQKTPKSTVVIGDLVTGVQQLGPVIKGLYDRDMRMMSLAYNQLSDDRRRYFVHFAAKGRPSELITGLVEMVKLTE